MTDQFVWSLPSLNKHQFIAFGNLLALRNGGQVEPASSFENILDEDESEYDGETSSVHTDRPDYISSKSRSRLKKFLDCLAEFAATKKGGKSVACAAMGEAEESVTVWIARNEGFRDVENYVLDTAQEGALGGLYIRLLHGHDIYYSDLPAWYLPLNSGVLKTANFVEFWQVFQSRSLIQLVDAKGHKYERSRFQFLETYLSVPPSGPQNSVWSLKQFLVVNDPIEFPPIPAVSFDYRFVNC
ncbi:hypothetical protein F5884DRAFT_881127 [Xylogone sp. PMI_703]|nr:hypothetical protein F5884DRAFT_881127 [Xylogone sp. PMI_703]